MTMVKNDRQSVARCETHSKYFEIEEMVIILPLLLLLIASAGSS